MHRLTAPGRSRRPHLVAHWRLLSGLCALLILAGCTQAPAAAPPATTAKPAAPAATTAPAAKPDVKPAADTRPAAAGDLADKQEITVGVSRNLVNGEHDFLDVHASLQIWEPLIRY